MRYLGVYDVLAVAARVLRCDSEDAVRRTDLDSVERALADVRRTSGLAEAAGVLLSGLIRAHAFSGANRTVAVAVVLQFVTLNQADLRLEPVDELDDLLDRIAADQTNRHEVAGFIQDRLEHLGMTAAELHEHLRLDLLLEDEIPALHTDWQGMGERMFEHFNAEARRAVVVAQEAARSLDHTFIGTEHLLLGLIEAGQGGVAKVLSDKGIAAPAVRDLVLEIIGRGEHKAPGGHIPFTPRAKHALEQAYKESRRLRAEQLGPEHLLLALIHDGEGVAAQVLTRLGGQLDELCERIEQWIDRRQRAESVVADVLDDTAANWATFGRRHHLIAELNAVLDENERLHEQVARLRDLLRKHDIDPDS
jgi:prophage maintenance system killer protein